MNLSQNVLQSGTKGLTILKKKERDEDKKRMFLNIFLMSWKLKMFQTVCYQILSYLWILKVLETVIDEVCYCLLGCDAM
jgi:hypothetical protein